MRSISGTPAIDHIATRRALCVEIPWARVRSPPPFLTLPPDDNNATVRLVARGIEQARRGGCRYPEGTTERYPSPDDDVQHGNARRIRSAPRLVKKLKQ